ncbi:MAG: sensor domain-containing protein, partial [Ilumatobacteraceae bacterium]
ATAGVALLLGHDAAAAVGRPIFDYVHPDDVESSAQLFARRLEFDGADLGHETRLHHSSGSWIPMVVTAVLVPGFELGAIAITIRSPDSSAEIERSLRQRVVIGEYCHKLSTDLMELSEPSQVIDRISSVLQDIAVLTGAEIVDLLLEHRDRTRIERQARWILPGLGDVSDRARATVDRPDADASEELFVRDVLTYDPELLQRLATFDGLGLPAPVGLLSSSLSTGGQRGVLRLVRVRPGLEWSDADAELVRTVAAIVSRALRTARSEQLLALTYREGPLGFSIRTWDGVLVDCNRQYLDLFGLKRAEADELLLPDILLPAHRAGVAEQLAQLRRGEVDRFRTNVEVIRGDGESFWARTHTVPLQVPGSSEQFVLTSVEDVTETQVQRLELEHAVRHDSLTGVANRAAMAEVIERLALRDGELPSLLVIDLDRFKTVNDSHGHVVGDEVLKVVADRISTVVRSSDLVARLGGDEFAIVAPRITADGACRLADRLVASGGDPLDVRGRSVVQRMSIGIALGASVASATDLLVSADRALYSAKERGRNGYVLFDDSLHDEVLERLSLEGDLRSAMERSEFVVHFQPEFSIVDGRIVGVEALLRWDHPRRGFMLAGEFIAVAEQSGVIDELGRYVLREACGSFAEISERSGADSLVLRVNISAREFSRPDLPDAVRAALAETGLDPSRLCLEMTETTLMDAPGVALETFAQLHAIGVQSAIDDFGTGYSSLSYLKRFPVDSVKIDRTFVEDIVTDPDSRAIVEAILRLADAMGLETVAEGVETTEQLEMLRQLGCDRVQGFLFAGALPPAELSSLLTDRLRAQIW